MPLTFCRLIFDLSEHVRYTGCAAGLVEQCLRSENRPPAVGFWTINLRGLRRLRGQYSHSKPIWSRSRRFFSAHVERSGHNRSLRRL